jgi:uncharacterized membrane protein
MTESKKSQTSEGSDMPTHVGQKIQTIATLFAETEKRVGRHQHIIERMTDAVGRPLTTYLLALAIVCWIAGNEAAPHFGFPRLDPPPFFWLQGAACVAAVLMTVSILTTQNRVAKLAQHRARLDLQVNLIAEEKIAKLIALVEELRRDLPSVKDRHDSLAAAMTEAVDVQAVAGKLEAASEFDDP